ncbi:MAG: hypothetical protein AAFY56_03900, partial [Pseudomonadota bacterium]
GRSLGHGSGTLTTFPASLGDDRLRHMLTSHDHCAVLKVGRHFHRLRAILEQLGRLETSVLLSDIGWPDETIRNASEVVERPPYFSILLTSR